MRENLCINTDWPTTCVELVELDDGGIIAAGRSAGDRDLRRAAAPRLLGLQ